MSAYRAWIRGMPCIIALAGGDCDRLGEPHHVKARGAGGRDRHCVPICRIHHEEGETGGWVTWQRKYGIRLMLAANLLYEAWLKPRPVESVTRD